MSRKYISTKKEISLRRKDVYAIFYRDSGVIYYNVDFADKTQFILIR